MPMRSMLILISLLSLSACNTWDRVKNIGKTPKLTPVQTVDYPPVERSLAHQNSVTSKIDNKATAQIQNMIQQQNQIAGASLWRTGSRAFFRDQRAHKIGDILTINIEIDDKADIGNTTSRSRDNNESAKLPALFGLEQKIAGLFNGKADPLVDAETGSKSSGTGTITRNEKISLTAAAVVTKVFPNGNMLVQGRQEVRVNNEVRELIITGIVRPEDIKSDNTIKHSQIAEARISYGGRGQLTDVQQARYGQQLFDALFPF